MTALLRSNNRRGIKLNRILVLLSSCTSASGWTGKSLWSIHWGECERDTHADLHNPHGVDGQTKDLIWCKWTTCTDERRYGSIPRHIVTLKVTFHCLTCQQSFSRGDCVQQHLRVSDEHQQMCQITFLTWQAFPALLSTTSMKSATSTKSNCLMLFCLFAHSLKSPKSQTSTKRWKSSSSTQCWLYY